jgi:hypothetical protein
MKKQISQEELQRAMQKEYTILKWLYLILNYVTAAIIFANT